VRIWLASQAVGLRRSFDHQARQVRQHLGGDPLSGHVFVFCNKRSDPIKLLHLDEDGFVIVYKRLEQETVPWPGAPTGKRWVTMRAVELSTLFDGIDWPQIRRCRRYHRPATG
jgi:transposase